MIEGRGLIARGGQRKGQEFIRGLEPKGYDWKGGRKRMKPTRKPAIQQVEGEQQLPSEFEHSLLPIMAWMRVPA